MRSKSRRQEGTERFGSEKKAGPERSRASRRDRKRAAIIAAAKEVFFREGYAAASMDRITARSKVSKATVYAHFGSKDDLLLAVVEDVLHSIRSAMTDLLPWEDDLHAWLMQLGRLASRQLTSSESIALQRLAITEATRFPQIAHALQQARANAAFAAMVIPTLEGAMIKGVLKRSDPKVALSHFFEMCFGKALRDVLMGLKPVPSAGEIEAHVRLSVEAFMNGYAVGGSAGEKGDG